MNLQSTDFELFGLPAQFALDRAVLDQCWKDLQRKVHPDKFADQGAAAQRLALQWSVRVNEAYQRLKDPLKRAAYLCEMQGAPVRSESNTAMPADFLMQQMTWREALDEAESLEDVEALRRELVAGRDAVLQRCAQMLDGAHDYAAAVGQVRALMFIERFAKDLDDRMDNFGL